MLSEWRTLFDGPHMEVYLRQVPGGGVLCITFDQMGPPHRPPGAPAHAPIANYGAAQAHVVTKKNDWYQNADLMDVFAVLAPVTEAYDRVVLYGGSMGGYGAMVASGYLKAERVVAVVPQFSVDPGKIPFDPRWDQLTSDLQFIHDDMIRYLAPSMRRIMLYDPRLDLDVRHIALYQELAPIELIKAPFAGHYPLQVAHEGGVLSDYVSELLFGEPDRARLNQLRRRSRRKSTRYLCQLAITLGERRNFRGAFRALTLAYATGPNRPEIIESAFNILQFDPVPYYGLSHLLLRLLKHHQPEWTHYDGALEQIWRSVARSNPAVNAVSTPPTEHPT